MELLILSGLGIWYFSVDLHNRWIMAFEIRVVFFCNSCSLIWIGLSACCTEFHGPRRVAVCLARGSLEVPGPFCFFIYNMFKLLETKIDVLPPILNISFFRHSNSIPKYKSF